MKGTFADLLPAIFKENYPMVKLVKDKLQESSIEQYKK
jgi:hypothetical protein